MRNLLGGLFALYVVELVCRNAGLPVDELVWWPFGAGFQVWQPITRFAVQGTGVLGVIIGLLMIYLLVPHLDALLDRLVFRNAMLAAALGGTALPMLLDPVLSSPAPARGWSGLVSAMFVLFGLVMPNGVVNLFFVLPGSGTMIVWGTLAIEALFFLIDPGLHTAEPLGMWLGTWGWWNTLGPGGRRRALIRQSHEIENQLRRFEVIEGGRDKPQGGQGDEWIH